MICTCQSTRVLIKSLRWGRTAKSCDAFVSRDINWKRMMIEILHAMFLSPKSCFASCFAALSSCFGVN